MKNLFFGLLLFCSAVLYSQTQLFIPDTLVGPNITLTMHKDSVQFFPGNLSHTYSFNAYKYLGPTLIFEKGNNVNVSINNLIGDTTTLHWHGIHLPSKWDGGPHTPILPGASSNPQFTIMDHAATYWYHPHMHMKTAEQAIKGAAGLIIVRDPIEAALALPRKYGVDDFPIIVQCQQYDSNNEAMPLGMQDSTILINGARSNYGFSVVGSFPAQIVRMRILNASGERTFNFGFTGNKQFYQIASDGGLLDVPYSTTRVRLAPGERAELLLDLNGMIGQTLYLMSYASELSMGIQGGPTMPMPPPAPPMDSPLNGIDFNVMQINVIAQTTNAITSVPVNLTTNLPFTIGMANVTRTIRFTADSLMVMDGPFYFNDSTFDMMRIDYQIPLNNVEVWKLVNETMVAHPFHIHDVQFFIIDRNGLPPGPEESGRKDVVLVGPSDSVLFITKFEDFTDSVIPFMYHCHILMHEDDGMMGQFVVMPNSSSISELNNLIQNNLVYPNPASDILHIEIENIKSGSATEIKIYDLLGKLIFADNRRANRFEIDCSLWSRGLYTISIIQEGIEIHKKIIIQN